MASADDFRLQGHWVERRLRNGMLVPCWVPPMPRISDRMLDCVFYLYPDHDAAEGGEHMGGSGFLLRFPFKRANRMHLYAVANRHVVADGNCTLRINDTKDGKCFPVDSDERKWFFHPDGDDIAIILVDFPITFESIGINYEEESFVTEDLIQKHDIGVGDDAFVIARFINHEGKEKNNPVAKFGNIAQMPLEPIKQENGHLQESYLIEARTIGGYSGSPVFAHISPMVRRPRTGNQVTTEAFGPWLLGLTWGYLIDWTPVCDPAGKPIPGMQVAQNSGMMGVVPIWKLIEMIKHPKMVAERKAREDTVLGEGLPISTNAVRRRPAEAAAPKPEEGANPDHLEDFNRLVSAASKSKPKGDRT